MDGEKRYESLEVLAIAFVGLVLRLFAGRNSLLDGVVLFDGYDAFYHMRRIVYTVNHFPNVIWSDSYLDYPNGLNIGWPPLYDQINAAVALAFGQHSISGVEMVGAVLPIFIGALAVAAIYYMVREVFDRKIALLSAFMVALAPYHLQTTKLGAADHHGLEVLMLILAITFLVIALSRPKRRYLFATVAGVFMAGLVYTWVAAPVYLVLIAVYAVVQMTLDLRRGSPSEDSVTAILAAFCICLVLILPFWNLSWISPSFYGVFAIIVAICITYALSKAIAIKKVHWATFPVILVVLAYLFLYLSQFLGGMPFFSRLIYLIQFGGDYIFGGGMAGKISEAEPLFARPEVFFSRTILSNLGWNLLFSVFGSAALVTYMAKWGEKQRRGGLLLFTWALYSLILTIGQIRFLYLSSIVTGVLIAILFFRTLDYIESSRKSKERKLSPALTAVLLLILVLPTAAEVIAISDSAPQITGDWYDSLVWLEKNSSPTAFYDNPEKAAEYSIMSWWDYGNWILYESHRPVVASNFQTGVEDSARFFLAESEGASTSILDARKSKYVITDFDLLYGKLPAMTSWLNEDPSTYQRIEDYGSYVAAIPLKRLMDTTLARLHLNDASGMGHFRLIHESNGIVGSNPPTSKVKIFEYVPGALITGTTAPDQPVGVLLNMTSNLGRHFQYFSLGVPKDGKYEIRMPYSTAKEGEVHALDSCMVFAGGKTTRVDISDEDVTLGRSLKVDF